MSIQDLTLTINGGNTELRTVVSAVTNRALEEAGFTNVVNTVRDKDDIVPTIEHVPTLLDVCRTLSPNLFSTAISIEDSTEPGTGDEPEQDDDIDQEETLEEDRISIDE